MTRVVADASVIAPFFIPDEADDLREDVLTALADGQVTVPQHWRLEVANLAIMAVRRGRLSEEMLPAVMIRLADYVVETDGQTGQWAWSTTLDLSRQHRLTLYDAAYLELTLRIGGRIATSDKGLRKAATTHDVLL